ncbi:MAG: PASTA domain-containing protein [Bacteroidota bacterium]
MLENSGLKVRTSGNGTVVSQSLEAGSSLKNGQTITLRLK